MVLSMRNVWSSVIVIVMVFITSCSRQQQDTQAQGYIEGRYTYMATSVSGVLKALYVARGQQVKQGQPLFLLEAQPESDTYLAAIQSLQQAIAQHNATTANLAYAKLTYERYKILVPKHALQQAELDSAKTSFNALTANLAKDEANIQGAMAELAKAKWTKDQKQVVAPVDGIVFDTYYRLGEYTAMDEPVLSLLAPANIKAIFYVPEKILGSIQLNNLVSVHCDGCSKLYTGHISFISPNAEYTPPIIYSNETSEKLIYRIEAEFAHQDAIHLHPGQPIIVTLPSHDR